MRVLRARLPLALVIVACLECGLGAAGQDTLARAKDLYGLAEYDEALAILNRLHETASPVVSSEVAGYQVLCLLALGRTDDAQKGIEALVKADPLYRPSESTMSPRTRVRFDAVRRELLPTIVQQAYDKAKAAFDRKELAVALRGIRSRRRAPQRAWACGCAEHGGPSSARDRVAQSQQGCGRQCTRRACCGKREHVSPGRRDAPGA